MYLWRLNPQDGRYINQLPFLVTNRSDAAVNATYALKRKIRIFGSQSHSYVIILCGVRFVCGFLHGDEKDVCLLLGPVSGVRFFYRKFFLASNSQRSKRSCSWRIWFSPFLIFALRSTTSSSSRKEGREEECGGCQSVFHDDRTSERSYLKLWILFKPYFFPSDCSINFELHCPIFAC